MGSSSDATATAASSSFSPSMKSLLLAIVGLSFVWPCLGSSATMSFRHAMAGSASVITGQWHAVVMGAMYLVAIACCLANRHRRTWVASIGSARSMIVLGICGITGHVLLVTSPLMGDSVVLVTGVVLIGFALSVTFLVGAVLGWGFLLAKLPVARAIVAVLASTALSYGIQSLLNVLSHGTLLVYLVACPVFMAVLGWLCVRSVAGADGRASVPDASTVESASLGVALRGLPWRILGPAVALIYFEQVFSSLLFERYADWPQDNITITLVAGFAIWTLAALLVVRFLKARGAFAASTGSDGARMPISRTSRVLSMLQTTLFSALLVIYMAALLVTVVFPASGGLVVERLLVAAGSSFRVLVWISIVCAVWNHTTTPVVGYLTYVFFILALPVSRLAAILFSHLDPATIAHLTSTAVIVPTAGIVLFLIAAAFIVASVRQTRDGVLDAIDADGSEAVGHDAVCQTVAREAVLSARETDVLELVCRGYTAKRAGDKLGISESTVVSHMTHIYHKVGVSSKQELISLVEERRR